MQTLGNRPIETKIPTQRMNPVLPNRQAEDFADLLSKVQAMQPNNLHRARALPYEKTQLPEGNTIQNLLPKEDWKKISNYVRLNYPNWFNWATVVLHTLGGMLPFMSVVPESLSKGVKNLAINFSRWGVPISKLHNFYEALKGKRAVEAIARIAPTAFLPFLPFFNFQLAYGLSSGVNVVLEHIKGTVGGFRKEDGFAVNNQKVIQGFKTMAKNFTSKNTSSKEKLKLGLILGGASGMIAGAVPALLFARDQLNTFTARFFGSIRSVGGLLGDLSIILFSSKKNPVEKRKEQIIGSFYFIPTIMDFAQRWISQDSDANEIFNHIKTALNTIAELMWTHFSTEDNIRQEQQRPLAYHQS